MRVSAVVFIMVVMCSYTHLNSKFGFLPAPIFASLRSSPVAVLPSDIAFFDALKSATSALANFPNFESRCVYSTFQSFPGLPAQFRLEVDRYYEKFGDYEIGNLNRLISFKSDTTDSLIEKFDILIYSESVAIELRCRQPLNKGYWRQFVSDSCLEETYSMFVYNVDEIKALFKVIVANNEFLDKVAFERVREIIDNITYEE